MRALLIQLRSEAALEVLPADMKAQAKAGLNKKAHSAVILCLGNKVLREVTWETTVAGVCSKLETLYMTKSLANKLCLKKKLYTFYMPVGLKISEHIDEFNKIVLDLANIELYGREALTLEDVTATLNSKEIKERSKANGDDGEGLYVKGRTDRRDSRQSRGKARSKSRVAGELNASVEEKDNLAQVLHKRLEHISEAGLQVLEKQGLFGKKSLGSVLGGIIGWFKDEAYGKFKEWKQLVENQTGRTVKKLRTNNGLEFCNQEFEQLCIESEIARHLTVAEMPQQNGLAERMNKTLMDKVRCLLIQFGLPKTFWAKATCTAAYLIHRSPSTVIGKKTPIEMWSGHTSDYRMLRTLGCVAYSHVKQGKLEPRVVKYVLLGYPEGVKGYRLYRLDNESPKIVTNRNMVFNESVMYKDTLKDSSAGTDKSVEELQVEVELHGLSNRTLEEDHTNQEDDDDENAGDQETDQTLDLTDYQLSNMVAYAFAVAEEEDTHEPFTYQEAVAYEDNSKWKAAVEEEMDSLRKNKTWELVDHPAGQKLCRQTRFSSKFVGEPSTNPTSTIPKLRNRRRSIQRVEPFSLVETLVVTMADQRTMEQLLQAPTEGYGDAIVIPAILADAVKALVLQRSPPSTSVKAVEEICVTCGGPHPYYQCLATDGNVFPEYRDNIQGYVSAAAQ
ncbi:retrovirus-related pol polyprotein from transposon TNT 1-94 [Tanacetum coccineum]|uniref:Retrovirus-related pol polyprotein from transposon TNT 1-94 n=1 Tax=Tanacetum coccineum TaxID=301880 RepID=A0ABQ4XS05_9ASTR